MEEFHRCPMLQKELQELRMKSIISTILKNKEAIRVAKVA
jgi:hypothetical protein